jgi:hypothetical protein
MPEEHEHRTEDDGVEEEADAVEDLDVPEQQAEDVGGGSQIYQWWKKVEE